MDDYLTHGVMAAIDAATRITASRTVHATGYSLGGILLSIAAAAMARERDRRLRILSLFAAQHDFTEVGPMPARMHAEYLRQLFLENDLAKGRYRVGNGVVAISDIHVPVFAVGTETDHVAPWRSVFKIHLLADGEVTSALTTGGHNAGIVSEPGHRGRAYRLMTRPPEGGYVAPEDWYATAISVMGRGGRLGRVASRSIRRARRSTADRSERCRRPTTERCTRNVRSRTVTVELTWISDLANPPVSGSLIQGGSSKCPTTRT